MINEVKAPATRAEQRGGEGGGSTQRRVKQQHTEGDKDRNKALLCITHSCLFTRKV